MCKLIMMRGLPGSGKTTKAREIMESSGNFVRVNKDDIRRMMHFNKFNYVNEDKTKKAEASIVYEMLSDGYNVIVDDTNLLPRDKDKWQKIATQMNATFEEINVETPWNECIKNDNKRHGTDGHVGRSVIVDMAMRNGFIDETETVICDVDGTVADCSHRLHYLQGENKDWDGFFSEVHKDKPIQSTIDMVNKHYQDGKRIVFVSARNEKYRKETEDWLRSHDIPFFHLIMRKSNDHRPDDIVKKEILEKYFVDRSLIKLVIDDRPSVIRMWRSEGLDVLDVGKGVEF